MYEVTGIRKLLFIGGIRSTPIRIVDFRRREEAGSIVGYELRRLRVKRRWNVGELDRGKAGCLKIERRTR